MGPLWKLSEAVVMLAFLGLAEGGLSSGWISKKSAIVDRTGGRLVNPTGRGGGWLPQRTASSEGWPTQTVIDPGGGWATQVTMPFRGRSGEHFKPPSVTTLENTSSEDRTVEETKGNWFSWITQPLAQPNGGDKSSGWTSQNTRSSEEEILQPSQISEGGSVAQDMALSSEGQARTHSIPGGFSSTLPEDGVLIVESKLLLGPRDQISKAANGWISQNTELYEGSNTQTSSDSGSGWITQATMALGGDRGRNNAPGGWISQTAPYSDDSTSQPIEAGSGWITQGTPFLSDEKGQAFKTFGGWMAQDKDGYEDESDQSSASPDSGWVTPSSSLPRGGTKTSIPLGDRTSQMSWNFNRRTESDRGSPQIVSLYWSESIPLNVLNLPDKFDLRALQRPSYQHGWANVVVPSDMYAQNPPVLLLSQYNLDPYRDEYLYKYALSDGTVREERGFFNRRGIWTQEGRATWLDPEGNPVTTFYIADDKGYSAQGGDSRMMSLQI